MPRSVGLRRGHWSLLVRRVISLLHSYPGKLPAPIPVSSCTLGEGSTCTGRVNLGASLTMAQRPVNRPPNHDILQGQRLKTNSVCWTAAVSPQRTWRSHRTPCTRRPPPHKEGQASRDTRTPRRGSGSAGATHAEPRPSPPRLRPHSLPLRHFFFPFCPGVGWPWPPTGRTEGTARRTRGLVQQGPQRWVRFAYIRALSPDVGSGRV